MEILNILGIIFAVCCIGGALYYQFLKRKIGNEGLKRLENEHFRVAPELKQALLKYDVKDIFELKGLEGRELLGLLQAVSEVLEVFEGRIYQISEARRNKREFWTGTKGASNFIIQAIENKVMKSANERLDKQLAHTLAALDEEFTGVEGALHAIPEKFRSTNILERFREYILGDGIANTWEDCVKVFREDIHRKEISAKMDEQIEHLQAIRTHTRATAFFAGIIAWNTL